MLIYSIQNICDGKQYIGKTKYDDVGVRWKQHKDKLIKGTHVNKHLQHAWNKYGESSFTVTIIEFTNCENKLNELEIFHIKRNKTYLREYGYNLTTGGTGGTMINEVLHKISSSLHGRKLSHEHKESIRNAMVGRDITWKDKISAANKGKQPSPYAIQRSKELFTGKQLPDTTKKKISTSVKKAKSKLTVEDKQRIYSKVSAKQKGVLRRGTVGHINAVKTRIKKMETRVPKVELYNAFCMGLTIDQIAFKFNVGTATISRLSKYYFGKDIKRLRMELTCSP